MRWDYLGEIAALVSVDFCLKKYVFQSQYSKSKVLQNAPLEHSAILLTCINRYSVLKTNLFLNGCLRQVLLYSLSAIEKWKFDNFGDFF